MGNSKRYVAQRQLFAEALAAGKSPEEAARIAGYKGRGKTFAANARHKSRRADVLALVAGLQAPHAAEVQKNIAVSYEWAAQAAATVVERGIKTLDDADIKPSDIHRGVEILAKMFGWLAPEKREITGKDGAALVDLSKLSDEQLTELERILAAAGLGSGREPADED